jgi:hypothetical protein
MPDDVNWDNVQWDEPAKYNPAEGIPTSAFAYSVTYFADKLLVSLKEIIRGSGLSPERLTDQWKTLHQGLRTWLAARHLETVVLEAYDPGTDVLVGRWDFDISYGSTGEGGMWVDTEDLRYHGLKAGRWPSECDYRIVVANQLGRLDASGWSRAELRSTGGFVRQSIGTTISGNGYIKGGASYWRKGCLPSSPVPAQDWSEVAGNVASLVAEGFLKASQFPGLYQALGLPQPSGK